jgi:FkbM family methyltransferase
MTIRASLRRAANGVLAPLGVEIVRSELLRRHFRDTGDGRVQAALQRHGIELVIDIGANVGQFAAALLRHGYCSHIVSVEPLPDAHALLCEAAAAHSSWTVAEPMALGPRAGTVMLQVAGNSVSSSVLTMLERHVAAAPDSRPAGTVAVKQDTVDAAFAERVEGARTLIKIDTQGYEREVLLGASRCLQSVDLVLMELSVVPLYQGQWLWLEAIQFMREHGFDLMFLQPDFADPGTGQVLQYNGLFRRA